ncbi:MAG: hypothetical protein GY875_13325 [Gammaproteobacteria bacterium]|nr:hypothetical protein [Gammaproteobacteria bacterium]
MLATLTKGMSRTPTGSLLACLLVVLVAGCGGGPGDADFPQAEEPAAASRAVEIIARTGPIVAVRVGQTASLSDFNSYTSSEQPLSYEWSFSSKPDGSNAALQNATTQYPSFVADVRGDYRAQLVVSADGNYSKRAVQLVVATVSPERPTGPANHEGLSSICLNCHSDELDALPGPGKIPGKSANHVAASSMCGTCHTPLGFDIVPFVDHQEVFGNCSECHNGVVAIGKSEFHQPTSAECDDCHNTTSFFELGANGKFDHTGITGGCSGCHNGITAIGRTPTPADVPPGNHPITSSDCISCHTIADFRNAFPDHTGPDVVGAGITCDSCHGVSAIGPPNGHPLPAVDCATCHGIVSFNMGGVFNHRLVDSAVQTCESCHNETNTINAPPKSSASDPHPATIQDCGVCHGTDTFASGLFDHTGIANDCGLACHIADGSGTAGGMPPSTPLYAHMPTLLDCSFCHTPGTFTTGTYDHAGVNSGCTACHNDVISAGKPVNHIPTNPDNQDCADCHFSKTTFSGAIFNHAGIDVNNCVACHDANIATGKPLSTHLPTVQNCFECHNYTDTTFKLASSFTHSGINGNCESCHSGNPNYVSVGAIGKKTNHIPALNECVVCHAANTTNPGNFSPSAKFLTDVHANITNGCEGCHTNLFLPLPSDPGVNLVKDANHVPTSQDCDVCHSVNGFTPTTMLAHEGITGNCVSCHNGNFSGVGARAKTPTTPPDNHPVTSADCALCHDTNSFANAFVDHSDPAVLAARCDSCHIANGTGAAKGMDAGHVVTTQDCDVCHVAGGSFKPAVFNHAGIVDNCASCHVADGSGSAIGMDANHIATTADCSLCHNTTAFAGANFDHQLVGINDTCESCHNGVTSTGKSNFHVPTNGDCRDCHQTTGFKPATFSHAGIVNNCASCHDAGFATPKKSSHVPTNQDCGVCHTPNAFKPATFDHTGITNNCASCHDGTTAKGMMDAVPAHLLTNRDCSSCHTTATFAGGTWIHDASSIGNCDTCHSPGGGATFKPGGHLSTTEQCDECHTTNRWAPTNFSHDPGGNYPGDHRKDPGCNGCHKGSIGAGINSGNYPDKLKYAPFCAGCHANDFKRKDKHRGGENGTVAQNKNCAGSGCHKVRDKEF